MADQADQPGPVELAALALKAAIAESRGKSTPDPAVDALPTVDDLLRAAAAEDALAERATIEMWAAQLKAERLRAWAAKLAEASDDGTVGQ